MSDKWHGGKGSTPRPVIKSEYDKNFSNIDWSSRKSPNIEKSMTQPEIQTTEAQPIRKYLMLDDIREVRDCQLHDEGTTLTTRSGIPHFKWDIVRSYEAFVEYIENFGVPDVISFDNDLDTTSMMLYCDAVAAGEEYDHNKATIKTGTHCAEWLVERCIANNIPIPTYYVHSANHFARPKIRKILEDAKQQIQTP